MTDPTKNPPVTAGEQETGTEPCEVIVPQDDPRTEAERAHDEAGEAYQETIESVRPY